nr:ATP-binding cassette domain-containing protein [Butyrivibrio sp. FCS014]
MALLDVNNLSISFGGLRAVDNFNITIEKGELYGLIGPNGAGKTTVFNLLTGVYKPNEGIIRLDGDDITRKSTIEINHAGIARTFQNIRLFRNMSVIDNVKVWTCGESSSTVPLRECSTWASTGKWKKRWIMKP